MDVSAIFIAWAICAAVVVVLTGIILCVVSVSDLLYLENQNNYYD